MTPSEVAGTLEASGDAVTRLLSSLPPAIARWKPAPREWCVNECVGHLIEAERRAFAGRIRIILDNTNRRWRHGTRPRLRWRAMTARETRR
ncbi:MAG: DinB family protein, partial [Chloroflexi bacterium]